MQRSPWDRLDVNCLSLIRRILAPLPSTRLSIEKIKAHRWFCKHIGNDIGELMKNVHLMFNYYFKLYNNIVVSLIMGIINYLFIFTTKLLEIFYVGVKKLSVIIGFWILKFDWISVKFWNLLNGALL